MNTMRAWRELAYGLSGAPDVEAAQRGLWRLLGGEISTNARNGTYGMETSADVYRARTLLGLEGALDTIGETLWEALQASFDETAWRLASRQPNAVAKTSPSCSRLPLSKGMEGSDVEAAQRALWRALQGDSTNARNGNYGDQTSADVARFRDVYAVNPSDSPDKIGDDLWAVLTRWMDETAVKLAKSAPAPPPKPASSAWSKVGDEAWWAYQNGGRFTYSQVRPIPDLHQAPPVYTDCSGLYTACCESAGVPNPNRSDGYYDGYGWTGTLADQGAWTTSPRRGDAALYGAGPDFSHVAIYLGDGTVVSFGSDPVKHLDVYYRADFAGFRTYR